MGCAATITNEAGQQESHGLNLLDIAKHAVLTVIKTLGEHDRLTVVAFDDSVDTLFALTEMDDAGQTSGAARLATLQPRGGTNLWKGLQRGLEMVKCQSSDRLAHVMLLTDGQTMQRDSCLSNLDDFIKEFGLPGTINTFGFGYQIDSVLLDKLAARGGGSYSFIPDAGFVGTVFVNTMSNLLVSWARDVSIRMRSSAALHVKGCLRTESDGEEVLVKLDGLRYGQKTNIVVVLKTPQTPTDFAAELQYMLPGTTDICREVADGDVKDNFVEVEAQKLRCEFVELLADVVRLASSNIADISVAQDRISAFAAMFDSSLAKEEETVQALREDVEGQTSEALSKPQSYKKWGRHFIPSLAFAHKLQMCNNFKDPGVQVYGGSLFKQIQEEADEIFNSLPPPVPATPARRTMHGSMGAPAMPSTMASYNNAGCGCIDGRSPVTLASGERVQVCNLKKGDLLCGVGGMAEVACVVRIQCLEGKASLVHIGDLAITPYHPICVDGTWCFPTAIAPAQDTECEAVFNFVLQGSPALVVDGVPCACLGHGLQEGAAVHPYFGSDLVVKDLGNFSGFADGIVHLTSSWAVRDPATGLVCGIRQ
uniref:VWFA domain-containing protein n=1 Tax=Noctiluca scintillans TaxID=2966 RepID=A0A7S1FE53_NOCSC